MRETYITTLPMDPKRSSEFFLFTTPFMADITAKATRKSLVLPINQIGQEHQNIEGYTNGLRALGITNYLLTYDNDPAFIDFIKSQITKDYNEKSIYFSKEKKYRCKCGAIEILTKATEKIQKRTNGKTFIIDGENILCKKCQNNATLQESISLLTKAHSNSKNYYPKVMPKLYTPQVYSFLDQFHDYDQLISRDRQTAIAINLEGKTTNIDNDYAWLNYGRYLKFKGIEISAVVASNHSLRKAAIYTQLIKEANINLIITPYISFRDKNPEFSMNKLRDIYSPHQLRAFLLTHLNWRVQNTFADQNLLSWCKKITHNLPKTDHTLSLDEITDIIKGHYLKTTIVAKSKNQPLDQKQTTLLSLL